MKLKGTFFTCLVFGALLLSALPMAAQLTVEVTIDQEQFLPGEKLPVAVRILNRSGQTLQLGADAEWLTFAVESGDGSVVLKTADVPVTGEFSLPSSKVAIKRVDLAPYFDVTKLGRYKITATVAVKGWSNKFESAPRPFDVIQGAKLWTQEFGVPDGSGGSPEMRRYTLQQATYLRTQPRLYFRLTDASESKVVKCFAIGTMVSMSKPAPQLDKWSNLHLLYQNGAHTYSYTVISPDGEMTLRRTYEISDTRPKLKVDADERFVISGGVRRISNDDLPAPKSNNDAKPSNL